MSPSSPLVSVLIVTYNGERYLNDAIASVLDEKRISLELVLVDNASTDGAVEAAVAHFADPRLRVVRSEENGMQAGGMNLALRAARGEFVALMDHDDLSCPDRFVLQLRALQEHPEWAGVACQESVIDQDGKELGPLFSIADHTQFLAYSKYEMPFAMHGLMLRRSCLAEAPWRTEFFWVADYDFVSRLLEAQTIGLVPRVLYLYRAHAGAITAQKAKGVRHIALLCRLAAARRRAGRPEDLAGLRSRFEEARAGTLDAPELFVLYARRFADEGFPDLALMFARRAWAAGRKAAGLWIALRVLCSKNERPRELWRMALWGPAHAMRVKSHPPLSPRRWNLFRSQWRDWHAGLQ